MIESRRRWGRLWQSSVKASRFWKQNTNLWFFRCHVPDCTNCWSLFIFGTSFGPIWTTSEVRDVRSGTFFFLRATPVSWSTLSATAAWKYSFASHARWRRIQRRAEGHCCHSKNHSSTGQVEADRGASAEKGKNLFRFHTSFGCNVEIFFREPKNDWVLLHDFLASSRH